MSLVLDASLICLGGVLGVAGYALMKLAWRQEQEGDDPVDSTGPSDLSPETDDLLDRVAGFSRRAELFLSDRHKDNVVVSDLVRRAFTEINGILKDLEHEKSE